MLRRTGRARSWGLWPGALGLVATLGASAVLAQDARFGSPGLPMSRVDGGGALIEDWGVVRLALSDPQGQPGRLVGVEEVLLEGVVPAVRAEWRAGAIAMAATMFRGPAWPTGMDVLEVRLEETAGRATTAALSLDVGEQAEVGRRALTAGGRVLLALPETVEARRRERDWGCTGEAIAMPGWAQPQGDCAPAFRNIRAGMGGVPIEYRFTVQPGATLQVVLGFCESFWSQAGQRPLVCSVEGALRREVDPLARWGRHQPGALRFDARDANEDGRLDVVVLPHPSAPDQNPILNAIWLFPSGGAVNLDMVVQGKLNAAALRYVDVGGEGDQTLYLPGKVTYELPLAPHAAQELTFLAACPGGAAPVPGRTGWTPAGLRQAARRVWQDWLSSAARIALGEPAPAQAYRAALVRMALYARQADGFWWLQPSGGADGNDALALCELAGALDLAGMTSEAERALRVLWDAPLPPPFASLARTADGRWPGGPGSQAAACLALARHALLCGDARWAGAVRPALQRGAEQLAAMDPGADEAPLVAQALSASAAVLRTNPGPVGKERAPGRAVAAALADRLLARARALEARPAAATWMRPTTAEAAAVWALRDALVREDGEALLVLPGATAAWLQAPGLSVVRLPTLHGRLSVWARQSGPGLSARVQLDSGPAMTVVLCVPEAAGAAPRAARVGGRPARVEKGRVDLGRLAPGSPVDITVSY